MYYCMSVALRSQVWREFETDLPACYRTIFEKGDGIEDDVQKDVCACAFGYTNK
jgi:hypothetical protein